MNKEDYNKFYIQGSDHYLIPKDVFDELFDEMENWKEAKELKMKDKLEPNMYVRTKWGYICKIININDFREPSMKYGVEASYLKDIMFIGDDDISKASHNIINLIEVGDYVNGSKVIDISVIGKDKEKWVWVEQMEDSDNKYGDDYVGYNNDQIKSIVTKEQFESMEYRLEEE